MTALIAGIDWSSKAIHAALIPLEEDHGDPSCPPVTFRQVELPKLDGDPTERIRAVRPLLRDLLEAVPRRDVWPRHEVLSVWVEEAWGNHRNTDRALLPIYGAIVASIPIHLTAAGISAREWRKELALDLNLTKGGAITEAFAWLHAASGPEWKAAVDGMDEHRAEALLVALAGRQINNRHFRSVA